MMYSSRLSYESGLTFAKKYDNQQVTALVSCLRTLRQGKKEILRRQLEF